VTNTNAGDGGAVHTNKALRGGVGHCDTVSSEEIVLIVSLSVSPVSPALLLVPDAILAS